MGKRKHEEAAASASASKPKSDKHVNVILADSKDKGTPCLAMFPGTQPLRDTEFTLYKSNDSSAEKDTRSMVFCETEKVSYTGANFGEDAARDVHCKYLVGVYSKSQKQLTIAPGELYSMRRSVKALSNISAGRANGAAKTYNAVRAELGNTFGTAKARQQIRDEERNKVEGEDLKDTLMEMQHEITQASANTPKQADLRQVMKDELPIPAHNMDATSPEEAYDLSSIVTDEELNSISVKELVKESSLEGIQSFLPFKSSSFVNDRLLAAAQQSGKKDRRRVRVLVYMSYLMAYYCRVRSHDTKDRSKVEKALNYPPAVIIEGLADRYTESNVRTSVMETKILCFLFVLCLSVADYTVFVNVLSKDLSEKPARIATLMKNLGCKVEKCRAEEAKSLGMKDAGSKAVLVLPLKFPEHRKGKRK